MIFLKLFLTFLEIGAVSFGGGYGMISLVREKVLSNDWLDEGGFTDFIAVSESTPGPLAVNMATFVGSSQAGFPGAVVATLGVVLPSFVIILLIVSLINGLMQYAGVTAFLRGVRPAVVGMILATALTMGLSNLLSFEKAGDRPIFDPKLWGILALLLIFHVLYKKKTAKKPSPILMIIISAGLGILFYGVLPF